MIITPDFVDGFLTGGSFVALGFFLFYLGRGL